MESEAAWASTRHTPMRYGVELPYCFSSATNTCFTASPCPVHNRYSAAWTFIQPCCVWSRWFKSVTQLSISRVYCCCEEQDKAPMHTKRPIHECFRML